MINKRNIVWGIILVLIGLISALNTLNITNIKIFFSGWWTLFIIIPSVKGLFNKDGKALSVITLIIGVLLLLCSQKVLEFEFVCKLIIPIILIVFGLWFIIKNITGKKLDTKIEEINKRKYKNERKYLAIFSKKDINLENEDFEGCEITSIFGGVDLDLRKANIKEDIVINVSSIFGGTDVHINKNMNVKINSDSVFGGVESNKINNSKNKVTIYINAKCIFGGVEIK